MIESNDRGRVADLNAANVRLDDRMSMASVGHTQSTAMYTNCRQAHQKTVRIDRERRRPSEMHIEYYLQDCHGEIPLSHTENREENTEYINILICGMESI